MPGRPFLQVPGPTNLPERVLRAMDRATVDHRGAEFAALTLGLLPKLRQIFRTESGHPVVLTASGTGGLEAALMNTLSRGDRVLAFAIGHFSRLWIRIAQRLGLEVEVVERPWGGTIPPEEVEARLRADTEHSIRAVLAIHNETSTGVTTDLAAIRAAMDAAGHPALLMVDTVSGVGCLDFRFDAWGLDVAVAGSQKGFLLPPGLAIVCVGEKARQARERADLVTHYWDWAPVIELNAKGFYPATPSTNHFFGLDAATDLLLEEGLEAVVARHARLAQAVRAAAGAWGLPLVAEPGARPSDTVSALQMPEGHDAKPVIETAATRYQLSLGIGMGPLAGRVFRIGHLGSLNELEILAILGGVELVLHERGVPITLGSGVAAAEAHLLRDGSGA